MEERSTTICYNFLFFRSCKGLHLQVVKIHEVHGVHWLEYGLGVHECIFYFIDAFIELREQIHCNLVRRENVLELFVLIFSNHIVINSLIIIIDYGPFLASKFIYDVDVVARSHFSHGYFFLFHDCAFKVTL